MTRGVRATLATAIIACLVVALAPAAASAFGPVSSFGSFGSGAGQMNLPGSLALSANGNSYVTDFQNNRIDVFSPQGAFLFAFGKGVSAADNSDLCTATSGCKQGVESEEGGSIVGPEGIAIAPTGEIYVANGNNGRIDVFSPQGAFLFAFGKAVNRDDGSDRCATPRQCQAGTRDDSAGAFDEPAGLGFGADGRLYLADSVAERIDVLSPQGAFLFAFGANVSFGETPDLCTPASGCNRGSIGDAAGAFNGPQDVESGPGGSLAVSDRNNRRIDVYSPAGGFLYAFGKEVNPADKSGICTAVSGCRAGVEDGSPGSMDPTATAIDGLGNVFVADAESDRIDQFTFAGTFIRAFGQGVVNGAAQFQVCDLGSGCQFGGSGPLPGAISEPFGVAVDCRGALLVSESEDPTVGRVERFAEPGTALCEPPVSPPPPAAKPSNRFKFGRVRLNLERGTATLLVRVPGPGKLSLVGRGVRHVTAAAKKASAVKLTVKPAGSAKRRLLKTAKAKVKLKVTYRPLGGTPLTKAKALTLRAALGR